MSYPTSSTETPKTESKSDQAKAPFGISTETITTVIDKDVEFSGSIKSSNGKTILVRGLFEGDMTTDGSVIVAPGGVIKGSVRAKRIKLMGTIDKISTSERTEVCASEVLYLESAGRLTADVLSYGALQMQMGGLIRASMEPIDKVVPVVGEASSVAGVDQDVASSFAQEDAAQATPLVDGVGDEKSVSSSSGSTTGGVGNAPVRPGANVLSFGSSPLVANA